MVWMSSTYTLASPSSKTYWFKKPPTKQHRRGTGGPPSTHSSSGETIQTEASSSYHNAVADFCKCVHTHSHEHTEWLLALLAVLVTEETQGFLSQHCNLKQSSRVVSSKCKVTTSKKPYKRLVCPVQDENKLLHLTWKPVFAERDSYENKTNSSSWIGCRSQKLTMCKYLHMKLRKQPRKKGFLKCSKFTSKKMWWLSYKIHSSNFSNPRFLLDTRESRHTFY